MSVTHDIAIAEHVPSEPPDPKALFSRLAAFSTRHRRGVIAVWMLVAFAAAPLALTLTGALSGAGWEAQGSTAQRVRDEIRRDFPTLGAEAPVVVYHQPTAIAANPAPLNRLVAQLQHAPHARAVPNPLALPAAAGLISRDGQTALIPVDQVVQNDAGRPTAAGELGTYVGKLTLASGAKAKVTGEWPVWSDFNKINAEALHKAELVSGLPTMILLFVAFGMLLAAGLPLILALAGIAVGFALLHVLGWVMPMSVWSMNFSMMIGLAVGIDYSLFIVSRYREERAEGKDALAAIENTMSTAGKAVFLSALTVVMALAAVFLVPVMVFRSMALGMILSVVAVALASLTLLPALLVALGDRVLVRKNTEDADITAESRWQRWTGVALRKPAAVLTLGLVVIGALIVPALGMHLGMPGAKVVDKGNTSRDGYDMLVVRVRSRRRRTRLHHHTRCRRPDRGADRVHRARCRRRTRRHSPGGNGARRRSRHRFDRRRRLPHCDAREHACVPASRARYQLRRLAGPPHRTATSPQCWSDTPRMPSASSSSSRSCCSSSCSGAS